MAEPMIVNRRSEAGEKESDPAPDVSSDRTIEKPAEPVGGSQKTRTPPLPIEQIESLEDDAKGG